VGLVGIHKGPVLSVAASPDGRWAASGGADHKLVLSRLADRKDVLTLDQPGPVRHVAFDARSQVLTAVSGGQLTRFSVADGKVLGRFAISRGMVILANDGSSVATIDPSLKITIWDSASGRLLKVQKFRARSMSREITSGAFSGDGTFLLLGGREQRKGGPAWAQLWTIPISIGGRSEPPIFGNDGTRMDGIAVTPDGRTWVMVTTIAPGDRQGAASSWNVFAHHANGGDPTELETPSTGALRQVALGPSGARLALVDEQARIYDVPTVAVPAQPPMEDGEAASVPVAPAHAAVRAEPTGVLGKGIQAVAFTPDRGSVLAATDEGAVRIYAIGPPRVSSTP
jgi:WD40 repeat protein